jgi:hypothetical protein
MGIEPTPRAATARGNGFEDRESHQAPCASARSLASGFFAPDVSRGSQSPWRASTDSFVASAGGTSAAEAERAAASQARAWGLGGLERPGGCEERTLDPRDVRWGPQSGWGKFKRSGIHFRGAQGLGGHFCGGGKGGGPQSGWGKFKRSGIHFRGARGARGALLRRRKGWGAAEPPADMVEPNGIEPSTS